MNQFDFMGVFALGVAAAGARTAMLIAPRVTTVMRTMASRARVHVARKARAKSAD